MLLNDSCEPNTQHEYPMSFRGEGLKKLAARATYSTDGTCGPQHGNTICDPNSKVYTVSPTGSINLLRLLIIVLGIMLLCKHAEPFNIVLFS